MKNILLLAAFTIAGISEAMAQDEETKINRFYLFGTVGPALFEGYSASLGLSTVVNRKWIASIGYLNASRNASAPSDMAVTRSTGWFGVTTDSHPTAETKFTYLSFGRYYPSTKRISYILDAGIGLARGQDYNYYDSNVSLKPGEQFVYGASTNYIVTQTDKTSLGLIARAGMDWAFSGGCGMGFDFYYNACAGGISDNVGFNLRFMIGYMPRSGKNAMK